MQPKSIQQKVLLLVLIAIGWFALIAQFYLILLNRKASVGETIVRYFSFFTILTNLLVAVCCPLLLLWPKSQANRFFSRLTTLTAITVYIIIVGLVYNIILRFLWKPQGLQMVVDELLHTAIPLLFFIYWLVFVPKQKLPYSAVVLWLAYPFFYAIYIMIRGSFAAFYPYPFIDVSTIGLKQALINSVILTAVFLLCSLLFVAITRRMSKRLSGFNIE